MPTGLRRAGEGDLIDTRVCGHPDTQIITAAQPVNHPRRKRLLGELCQLQVTERRIRRRLENHRTARHHSRSDLPDSQQNGEIPWNNGTHHAHRGIARYDATLFCLFDHLIRQSLGRYRSQPGDRPEHFPF